ncbi:cytochrome c [bacterium]|nr:cytochrome c [bacterium]MBU1989698.1 cytochrome c [bacterium]
MKRFIALLFLSSLALMAFDGDKAYKNCIMCHGKTGEKVALSSSPKLNTLAEQDLQNKIQAILNGSSGMSKKYLSMHKAKLKGVEEADAAAFAAYILNLK